MPWVTAIVLLPLVGSLAMLAVPEGDARQARAFALVASAGTLVMTAILVGLFDRDRADLQFVDRQDWAKSVGADSE